MPGINLAMGCRGLTIMDWLICIVIGASELPFNFVVAMLPLEWFNMNKVISSL